MAEVDIADKWMTQKYFSTSFSTISVYNTAKGSILFNPKLYVDVFPSLNCEKVSKTEGRIWHNSGPVYITTSLEITGKKIPKSPYVNCKWPQYLDLHT